MDPAAQYARTEAINSYGSLCRTLEILRDGTADLLRELQEVTLDGEDALVALRGLSEDMAEAVAYATRWVLMEQVAHAR